MYNKNTLIISKKNEPFRRGLYFSKTFKKCFDSS